MQNTRPENGQKVRQLGLESGNANKKLGKTNQMNSTNLIEHNSLYKTPN